jgi:CRP-like cAMP-binding protein
MVYLLKRGKVRIGRLTEDGKEVMLALLGPGDLFGEEVVFEAPARTTIATCIEESLLCMARAPDLYGLLARHPILAVNIAKYLKEQRDDALSTVEDVAYLKVPDRLMKLLERLAAEYGAPTPQGTRIDVRLTQADLASLIGSTRETVSLELSQFERAGRIRMDGRAIVLCDAPRGALTAASA